MWKWLPTDEFTKTGTLRRRDVASWLIVETSATQAQAQAESAHPALSEVNEAQVQIGDIVLGATPKAIAEARQDLTSLVREVGENFSVFIIHNAKNPSAPPALLINPDELSRRISVAKRTRKLGQVIAALPFKSSIATTLDVGLPDDVAPNLLISSEPPTETSLPSLLARGGLGDGGRER